MWAVVLSLNLLLIFAVAKDKEQKKGSIIPRVVATFTSFPGRINYVMLTIKSLINQSYKLDAIHFNVPRQLERFENHTWDESAFQQQLDSLKKTFGNNLQIHRVVDYGPATKLLGVLPIEEDPNTILIVVDDDVVYQKDMVKLLINGHMRYPEYAITTKCEVLQIIEGDWKWPAIKNGQLCKGWACAYKGILYRRNMFDNSIFNLKLAPRGCWVHDDVYIAGYLYRRGIRSYAVKPAVDTIVVHNRVNKSLTVGGTAMQKNFQKDCIMYFDKFDDSGFGILKMNLGNNSVVL